MVGLNLGAGTRSAHNNVRSNNVRPFHVRPFYKSPLENFDLERHLVTRPGQASHGFFPTEINLSYHYLLILVNLSRIVILLVLVSIKPLNPS